MRRRVAGLIVAVSLLTPFSFPAAQADVIKLKDGRTVEGEVLEETASRVKVKLKFGVHTYKRSEIASIVKKKTENQIYTEKKAALAKDDADGHYELALWAESKGMKSKAKYLIQTTLRIDPEHPGAHEVLGEKKVDGKWLPIAQADAILAAREESEFRAKGYVRHEGVWRSPDEMEKIRMGLIDHDGVWITREEKALRDEGLVKFKNRWVTEDERKMLARGFVKYQGSWVQKSEVLAKKVDWSDAYSMTTPHYRIQTNITEELCDELSGIMEGAYLEYLKVVGIEPKDQAQLGKKPKAPQRMPIYVFATKEEYNDFCRSHRMTNNEDLDGFYNARRNLVATWSGNNLEFIRRFVVSLGIWQYYFNSVGNGLPSWLSEGFAGYFNSSHWDGQKLGVGLADGAQLRFLKRLDEKGRLFSTNELITEDLHAIIQRGDFKRFAAQAYGLTYYLLRGPSAEDKAKFMTFLDKLKREPFVLGNADILGAELLREVFGGREAVEELGRRARQYVYTIGSENLRKFETRYADREQGG